MATCGARTKTCRNCGHRYSRGEYDLWACPECEEPRACKAPVKKEGLRCRKHGGATPGGIASPHFVHGRRSKYLPARLNERYREALEDPDLIALRTDIALIDARVAELTEKLETGESTPKWERLRLKYAELKVAQSEGDIEGTVAALGEIGRIIEAGGTEHVVWEEIYDALDRKRRLAEAERKRLVEMRQMVTAERLVNLMAAVSGVIKSHVTDRDTLLAISTELRSLTSRDPVL